MEKIFNYYVLSDKAIGEEISEVGLLIFNDEYKILLSNQNGTIDIPKIKLKRNANRDESIIEKINEIFETQIGQNDFTKFMNIIDYRYQVPDEKGKIRNEKANIEYFFLYINKLPINGKYKFLTTSHIKYLLDIENGSKYSDQQMESLKLVLNYFDGEEIRNNPFTELSVEDYKDHMANSLYYKNDSEKDISYRKKFLKENLYYEYIVDSTKYFINNIEKFNVCNSDKEFHFEVEKIYKIEENIPKLWYNDILLLMSKDNIEYLVSLYLVESVFNKNVKFDLENIEYDIKEDNKVLGTFNGLTKLVMYNDKSNTINKVLEKRKILR